MTRRFLDIFCGCGLASLGLVAAGFDPVMASDWSQVCHASYAANFPLARFRPWDFFRQPLAELLSANGIGDDFDGLCWLSPTCKGLSTSGPKLGWDDPRNRLLFVSVSAAKLLPRAWLVIENVRGLCLGNAKPIYDELTKQLREAGRDPQTLYIDAADFGLARRSRIFIVCPPMGQSITIAPVIPGVHRALGQIIHPTAGFVDPYPWSPPLQLNEMVINGATPPGGNWQDTWRGRAYALLAALKKNPREFPEFGQWSSRNFLKRLAWDQFGPCITAKLPHPGSRVSLIHPTELRRLTLGEIRELLGIPRSFILYGSPEEQWEQAGNCVVPCVAQAIAMAIQAAAESPATSETLGTRPEIAPEAGAPPASPPVIAVEKRFDVVLMNPPYQPPVDRSREDAKKGTGRKRACGSRNVIWDKFVKLGLKLCANDGHCAFIHPPSWRKPGHELWPVLSPKITYLEMHNAKDGKATFGAQTRYDWYILANTKDGGPADVFDEAGSRREMDLADWPWLPSGAFDDFKAILARPGDERLEVLYSRSRHAHDRAGVAKDKSGAFPYPCVHAIHKGGEIVLYYAAEKSEMFAPKVILCEGGYPYPVIDAEGTYGLTEYCFGIRVDSPEEAARIRTAIESPHFRAMIEASKWSSFRTEHAMFAYFRRDFWKFFIEDERKEVA